MELTSEFIQYLDLDQVCLLIREVSRLTHNTKNHPHTETFLTVVLNDLEAKRVELGQ